MNKLLSLYGLKFNPFRPDIPVEALYVSPAVESFCARIEFGLPDGGFLAVSGDPGTSKSATLRIIAHRLRAIRDICVGVIEHPQSRVGDFYLELGDIFGVPLRLHNRWNGFKALRAKWSEHIASSMIRPVLIVDETQEMLSVVLNELRVLSSKELDSKSLLTVIIAGDSRLTERLRTDDLLPVGSRIRRRLVLEYASREELCACLDHVLKVAGNPALMAPELKTTLADHAAGNYRVMMNIADELLAAAAERDLSRLDEKLFFEIFATPAKPKPAPRKK
jgi:type II secretory pathway predicted ATPase ExeA